MKYGMFALLALLASTTFQSCNDDKDIVVITEELPLKLGHLYMVGDATPAGWNIDNPFEMTKDANDNFIFTYHGKLNVGELKSLLPKVIGVLPLFMLLKPIQRSMLMVLQAVASMFVREVLTISGRLHRQVIIT